MSKKNKNGGGFDNIAASKFSDMRRVSCMTEFEIVEILNKDFKTVLAQIVANRRGDKKAKYPEYIRNAFANLSTSRYMYIAVKDAVKVSGKKIKKSKLTFPQLDAMRVMIADAIVSSNRALYQTEQADQGRRNYLLEKTYRRLDPRRISIARKLFKGMKVGNEEITKEMVDRRATILCAAMYLDPAMEAAQVVRILGDINTDLNRDKVMKIIKKLLKMTKEEYKIRRTKDLALGLDRDPAYISGCYVRFAEFVGYAFTVDRSDSSIVELLIDFVSNTRKNDRKIFIMAFGNAYKRYKKANFHLCTTEFYEQNRKIFKKLADMDIGYKKAFEVIGRKTKLAKKKKERLEQKEQEAKDSAPVIVVKTKDTVNIEKATVPAE